jgi:hypothetical protein
LGEPREYRPEVLRELTPEQAKAQSLHADVENGFAPMIGRVAGCSPQGTPGNLPEALHVGGEGLIKGTLEKGVKYAKWYVQRPVPSYF